MRSTIIGVLFLISACAGESSNADTVEESRVRRGILPSAQQPQQQTQQQLQYQQQQQQLAIDYRPLGEAPDAIRQILQLQQAREPLVSIPAPAPLQLQPQPVPQTGPQPVQPLAPVGPPQSPILAPQASLHQVPAPQPYINRYNQAALQQQQQIQQQQQFQRQQIQQQQQLKQQQQQQLRLQPVYKGIQQAVQRFGPQQQPLYTPQYKTSYPAQQQLQQPPPPPHNSLYRQPLPTPLQYRAQQLQQQQQQQQAQQSQQSLYPSNLPPHLQNVIQAQRSYQQG